MKIVARLFIYCVVVVSAGCVSNFNSGITSFKVQDYRQAFIRLMPEAEKGNPDAAYAIGYMYYYGQGVTENNKKAWLWINRAAAKNQPDAIAALKILKKEKALDDY